jgi:hypothetical protein
MFAGCTVTSGTVNDSEGGTVTTPTPDSGTDSAANAAASCPGNTKQKANFISAACQAALDTSCCAELTACFDIVPVAGDAGGPTDDCNTFSSCIAACKSQPDVATCENECNLAAPQDVQNAYDAITACATAKANTACQ